MTDRQVRLQNMAVATQEVLTDNQSLWDSIPAFVNQYTRLGNSIVRVDTIATLQGTDNTGYRALKLKLRNTMADKTMVVAGPLAAYARINGLFPLLAKVDINRTDITRGAETLAEDIARRIHTTATAQDPAVLGEVGISSTMLTELDNAIVAFNASLPGPRAAEGVTVAATQALAKAFEARRSILTSLDELVQPFRLSAIDFYNAYKNARKIVGSGVRKIHLIVKCLDKESNAVVAGAEVRIVELSVSLISTRTGNARFFSLPPGSVTVQVTHPLYKPITLQHVGIFTNRTVRFELLMERS